MSHDIRIAYLVSRYPAISHTFILREVLALRRLGFQIDVASINPPDRQLPDLTADERTEAEQTLYIKSTGAAAVLAAHVKMLCMRPSGYLRALWFALRFGGLDLVQILYGFFYFVEAVVLGEWMRTRRQNHLHVHFATPAATVGLILTRLLPVTLSITVHGPDEFYDTAGYRLKEKIQGSAFLCAIGSFARSQLMKLSAPAEWSKIEVTPLGIDPNLFVPRKPKAIEGPFEILCVGRLVPAKGQHILLQAFAQLRARRRDTVLRFVGDGPDRASLEAQARAAGIGDSVRFEGAVNQDAIRGFYESADVFALASFAEGIPVVLMEAMAMEIPCVSTRITGIPELIRDGIDGALVMPSDANELAATLEQLMDDPALRLRYGRAGRARVIEKYNLDPNIRRLAEVFERKLNELQCAA